MFKQVCTTLLSLTIVSLALILSVNTTWADTYSASIVIKYDDKLTEEDKLVIVEKEVEAKVKKNAVDSFLEERHLNEIQITAEMEEQLVGAGDDAHYDLIFHFEPSGLYFDKPMELKIKGKYAKTGEVWLYDEMGFPLEGKMREKKDKEIVFDIDHFSDYYLEDSLFAAYYQESAVMDKKGGKIRLNKEASIRVPKDALNAYLEEQGIDEVEITVEMFYGWDGSLLFIFGPSGAYFDPQLELTIQGGYIAEDMILLDENFETLEYQVDHKGQHLTFFIPHFSRYSYDMYDYY